MNKETKENLIVTILRREKFRPLGRLKRLLVDPARAFPFYILAAFGHIRPYSITFKTLWNTDMRCYLPEGNTFYYYGYCEANLTNFFLRYVKSGSVCVDIGAHVGFYSMLFSALVGPGGAVHSFEPTPWTYELLRENTHQLGNVRTNNDAVAEKASSISFADYGHGYGAYNSAHPDGAASLSKKSTMLHVQSVSIDEYCAGINVHSGHLFMPDIIKIDAEGYEYNILRGGEKLFRGAQRPIVTLEVAGDAEWADNRKKSIALLLDFGYMPHEIDADGFLQPHQIKDSYTYDNLVFVPKERLNDIKNLIVSSVRKQT